MGIDANALDHLRQTNEVKDWIANISSRYSGKHLIVARDRLDVPGGIKQKLLAYDLFLKKYPKWRENVSVHILYDLRVDVLIDTGCSHPDSVSI